MSEIYYVYSCRICGENDARELEPPDDEGYSLMECTGLRMHYTAILREDER